MLLRHPSAGSRYAQHTCSQACLLTGPPAVRACLFLDTSEPVEDDSAVSTLDVEQAVVCTIDGSPSQHSHRCQPRARCTPRHLCPIHPDWGAGERPPVPVLCGEDGLYVCLATTLACCPSSLQKPGDRSCRSHMEPSPSGTFWSTAESSAPQRVVFDSCQALVVVDQPCIEVPLSASQQRPKHLLRSQVQPVAT